MTTVDATEIERIGSACQFLKLIYYDLHSLRRFPGPKSVRKLPLSKLRYPADIFRPEHSPPRKSNPACCILNGGDLSFA